jgi:UDP-glucose 4-epimerase
MQFKNKTILITGADGLIGSHLTEALVKKGAKVTGADGFIGSTSGKGAGNSFLFPLKHGGLGGCS